MMVIQLIDKNRKKYGLFYNLDEVPIPKNVINIMFVFGDTSTGTPSSFFNNLKSITDEMNLLLSELFTFKSISSSNLFVTATDVDLLFFSKYGSRKLSSYTSSMIAVQRAYAGYDATGLMMEIERLFYDKWNSLYNTIITEYDPIKPFNIALDEDTTDLLEVLKDKSTYIDNEETYGSNSSLPKPTDKSHGSRDNEYSRINPKSRKYTRVGNIGNRSSAELIMQEREKLIFRLQNVIFEDILSVIARKSYGD